MPSAHTQLCPPRATTEALYLQLNRCCSSQPSAASWTRSHAKRWRSRQMAIAKLPCLRVWSPRRLPFALQFSVSRFRKRLAFRQGLCCLPLLAFSSFPRDATFRCASAVPNNARITQISFRCRQEQSEHTGSNYGTHFNANWRASSTSSSDSASARRTTSIP